MQKIIIVGGGLWGGLLALRLKRTRTDLEFILHEREPIFGGNHTWSFHESDISPHSMGWIRPLISHSWSSYKVKFPQYEREIHIPYHTISSTNFHRVLIESLDPKEYLLNSPFNLERVSSDQVIIDARGIQKPCQCGYQKFLGLEVETNYPHGLKRPLLMDATVRQEDGFRFFYVLPLDERKLLIEDTRYSEVPTLDEEEFTQEILNYAKKSGWKIRRIQRKESGALSIPFNSPIGVDSKLLTLSGHFHDVTGYSFADAVRVSELLSASPTDEWMNRLDKYRSSRSFQRSFFRTLNRFMFFAASSQERYKVLEFFYRSNESSIKRFYAGEMSPWNTLTFFAGKPPVSITKALKILMTSNKETV